MPEYVEVHADLIKHPKMERLRRILRTPAVHLQGHLTALWQWTMRYAPNGDLSHCDAIDIASAALWEGDEEAFVAALIDCGQTGKCGFLERTRSGKLIIHNWHHYGGKILINRFKDNYRKTHKQNPTDEQVRAAGLIPAEMWGSDPEITLIPEVSEPFRTIPTENPVFPPDSAGFQRSVAERSVSERSVSERSSSVARTPAHEADPQESVRYAAAAPVKTQIPEEDPVSLPVIVDERLPKSGEKPGEFVARVLPLCPPAVKRLLQERWNAEVKAGTARAQWPFQARILTDIVTGKEPMPEDSPGTAPPAPPKRVQGVPPFPPEWFPGLSSNEAQPFCMMAWRRMQVDVPGMRHDDNRVKLEAHRLYEAQQALPPPAPRESIRAGPEGAGAIANRVMSWRKVEGVE